MVLGADLLDAETAALCAWINRAVSDAELDRFVTRLAGDIAALDPGVIEGAKRALAAADLTRGLNVEHDEWNRLVSGDAPARKMKLAMERDLQTIGPGHDLEDFLRQVAADI